jgi:hypothetical protein
LRYRCRKILNTISVDEKAFDRLKIDAREVLGHFNEAGAPKNLPSKNRLMF